MPPKGRARPAEAEPIAAAAAATAKRPKARSKRPEIVSAASELSSGSKKASEAATEPTLEEKQSALSALVSRSEHELESLREAPNRSKRARLLRHLKKYRELQSALTSDPSVPIPRELLQRPWSSESERVEFQRKRQARVLGKDDDYNSRVQKSEDLKQARRERKKEKLQKLKGQQRKTVCFSCNRRGHTMEECPDRVGRAEGGEASGPVDASAPSGRTGGDSGVLCYNCGESGHSLRACPHPTQGDGLGFAECFVCHQRGHTAGKCPSNENGIYRYGGACHKCGGKDHLAKDCTQSSAAANASRLKACSLCGDPSHFARDCPQSQPREKKTRLRILSQPSAKVVTF